MLTETERLRFNLLKEKKQNNALNHAEQTEWQGFVSQIEAEEAVYLRLATERIQRENAELEAQNHALKVLIQRKAEAARFLLAHGAEPNLKDEKGLTALDLAKSQHHPDVAQVLLAAGAKP